jgi:hypothetical protein
VISCTKFVHNCFPYFDADAVIKKMMASPNWPNNKLFGKTAEIIKKEWDINRNISSSEGTAMHLAIEKFMNGAEHLISEEMKGTREWKYFTNFWKDVNTNLVPFRTEWCVWSEEYKLAGSIDMVFYRKSDDSYVIYDWKRSKEIKTANNFANGFGPVSHLPDCNYWHYTLQLNIYKYFLEKFYGLNVVDLCLVILHPDNKNYRLIRLNMLEEEVESMLECRKRALELNVNKYVILPIDECAFIEEEQ